MKFSCFIAIMLKQPREDSLNGDVLTFWRHVDQEKRQCFLHCIHLQLAVSLLRAQVQHLAAVGHHSAAPTNRNLLHTTAVLLLFLNMSFTHVRTAAFCSPLPFPPQPHVLEVQGGGPSMWEPPMERSVWYTLLRGEVVLHHKLNKTRKMFSVYSSWVQGQTTSTVMRGGNHSSSCFSPPGLTN